MNLEDLRAVRSRERASDGLQEVRESFYEDVAEYIEELREERDRAAAEASDPFGSDEVQALTDEIETAEQVAEAIYERRMGKLVKQASLDAADMAGDTDGLTAEEQRLYDDLVERIEENKARVFDVLGGEVDAVADDEDGAGGDAGEANVEPEDVELDTGSSTGGDRSATDEVSRGGGGLDPDSTGPGTPSDGSRPDDAGSSSGGAEGSGEGAEGSSAPTERTTVRITRDVGEVFGVDERQYTLEAEDVVTLPVENAKPLVERDAAEEL